MTSKNSDYISLAYVYHRRHKGSARAAPGHLSAPSMCLMTRHFIIMILAHGSTLNESTWYMRHD
jgi:hypothetical protein